MTKNILRLSEVENYTSLSRATIYRLMKDGRFPKNHTMKDVKNRVIWLKNEIDEWFLL